MPSKSTSTRTRKSKSNQEMAQTEIVQLIEQDHELLKELIETLKDNEAPQEKREAAFDEFSLLLVSHAKPEEETLYEAMKANEELREDGFEGEVEHVLADQLLEEIKRTTEPDLWSARVKVLAELVEHHIEEEEEELLPKVEEELDVEERLQLGSDFIDRKIAYFEKGGSDTVEETDPEAVATAELEEELH
jgi:hemerythrin superfamily protein